MAAEPNSTNSIHDIYKKIFERRPHPLKRVTTDQLENAIAAAVCELCGSKFEVEVSQVDFHPENTPQMTERVRINVNLDRSFVEVLRETEEK